MEQRKPWMDARRDLSGAAERITRTFELLRQGRARYVLISGGVEHEDPGSSEAEQLSVMLQGWGVPADAISVETRSRNTHENAVESARIVAEAGWKSMLLVTSAVRMERALGCFRRAGLRPDALSVDYGGGEAAQAQHPRNWLPRAVDLALSAESLREVAGRLVYRGMGYTAE